MQARQSACLSPENRGRRQECPRFEHREAWGSQFVVMPTSLGQPPRFYRYSGCSVWSYTWTDWPTFSEWLLLWRCSRLICCLRTLRAACGLPDLGENRFFSRRSSEEELPT